MTRLPIPRLAFVLAALALCCLARPAAAQQMSFSIYTDSWTSSNHTNFHAVSTGYDNSWGCNHWERSTAKRNQNSPPRDPH